MIHFLSRLALLAMLLLFWWLALHHLERFPRIHYDEAIIVTPGYKLFAEGVYGSDLYTGFHRQEQIYLETPPPMPLLQGVSAWLLGVGVWQMRFVAVVAGTFVLPLTYAAGARVAGSIRVGLLAILLLVTWRLTPGGATFLASGVTLLDVSRLARYDILVPVFGLSSLLLWWRAMERARAMPMRGDVFFRLLAAGLAAGLAGLANIYGLFWIGALAIVGILTAVRRQISPRVPLMGLAPFLLGGSLPWLLWGVVLLLNWEAAAGQFVKHTGRFDLLNPAFYLNSLLAEPQRYALGFRQAASYGRLGFWLFVVGVPSAMVWLGLRAWRGRDGRALLLLAPAVVIPLALALLVNLKRNYYIVTVIPLLALILAWAIVTLAEKVRARRPPWLWRAIGFLLLSVWVGQWLVGLVPWQARAEQAAEPAAFFETLRALLPADSVTIGPPDYWFAFYDREYRSLGLLFVRSNPGNPDAVSWLTALEEVDPDYILHHPSLPDGLAVTDDFDGGSRTADFAQYLADREATLLADLVDFNGDPVRVYRLASR